MDADSMNMNLVTLPKTITKQTIKQQVQSLLQMVEHGNASEAEIYVLCDALEKTAKALKKETKPDSEEYALGCEIILGGTTRYDYKGCCEYYDLLQEECKAIENVSQQAAKMKRPTPQNYTTIDGEQITILPAIVKKSDKITVNFQEK